MARAGLGLARGALRDDPTGPVADAVEALAELRGLATKAGQMAGVWSAALPEAERRRVEPLLARLRASTASSDPAAVRALVEAELGAPLGALFAEFDEAPFASASLGQVHRARLPAAESGLEVAVKVQHPGIDVALRADLDHAARFGGVAALFAVPGAGAMVDEFRARIAEELDYEAEGRWLTRFAALLAGAGLAIGTAWAGMLANFAAGAFMVILRPACSPPPSRGGTPSPRPGAAPTRPRRRAPSAVSSAGRGSTAGCSSPTRTRATGSSTTTAASRCSTSAACSRSTP
jgi:hypothetical protein